MPDIRVPWLYLQLTGFSHVEALVHRRAGKYAVISVINDQVQGNEIKRTQQVRLI